MTYNYTQTVVLVVAGWLRYRLSCSRTQTRPTWESGNNGQLATRRYKVDEEADAAWFMEMKVYYGRCNAGNGLPGDSGVV